MPGLLDGLELGKRALLTHQLTLQTIGHNIANVDTPGYSRQRVRISATMPQLLGQGPVGTGVEVLDIRSVRDMFLGNQYRQSNKTLGQWEYKQKTFTQIESLFGEPNDNTVSALLDGFWDAWGDLSTDPSGESARVSIVQAANLLTNGLHELSSQLGQLTDSIDQELVSMTSEINRLTSDIAKLNQQIKSQELGDSNANDLRDVRENLVDQLSALIDVNTIEHESGEMTVMIGAMSLVDGSQSLQLDATVFNANNSLKHDLVWKGTSISIRNLDGQLSGLIESRDIIIPKYQKQIDQLAAGLVQQVNAVHRTGTGSDGSTNIDFFDATGTTAATIRLSIDITGSRAKIASGATGEDGDNTIALALHDLRDQRVMQSGSATINEFYNGVVGRLGVETRESISFAENYNLLVQQIDNNKQAVQGVSLDEEMTNLVKYQHAFDAAARVITVMDQALDTVVTGMGVVGR
ncbi:MAG: flagellar hook-associated protein FlgK [Candidatus Zixiibacteriota bacterium]